MARRSLSWPALILALCLALGSPARTATVEAEARRLDDLLYFVRELDRGWDPLLTEIRRTITSLTAASLTQETDATAQRERLMPVLAVRDDAAWARAEELFDAPDEAAEQSGERLYRWLVADAVEPELRERSMARLAALLTRRGERSEDAGDTDGALAAYMEAVDLDRDDTSGYAKVGALGMEQAERREEAQDFDGALATLDAVIERVERGLGADHPRAGEAHALRNAILAGSGELAVRFLGDAEALSAVRGATLDLRDATLELEPTDDGATPPAVLAATTRRVRAGAYRAAILAVSGEVALTLDVTVTSTGSTLAVPAMLPPGMVFVPAAGAAGAFLCDRTEVSNAAYQEFAQTSGAASAGGPPDAAVCGVPFADAQRFAAWAGKSLPTVEQWTHAAFGAPGARRPRYPWGDEPGTPGVHFFAGRTEPGPVDGCPDGAAASGALNLAGNVFEWLADGWFIGGGYVAETFGATVSYRNPVDGEPTWDADFLRDKVPTIEALRESGSPELKNKHHVYRVTEDDAETFLRQVGLRCVVPLE